MVVDTAFPFRMYFGVAVDEFHISPVDFWQCTPGEIWTLLGYRKTKGQPEVAPMGTARMLELEAKIAERQQKKK